MIAAPIGAPISDRFGRRKTMFVGAVIVIIGMVVAVTSNTVAQVSSVNLRSVLTASSPCLARSSVPEW